MSLIGRIWQFLFGFLAYNMQQMKLKRRNRVLMLLIKTIKVACPYFLIFTLFFQVLSDLQLNRLFIMLLASLIVAFPDQQWILRNRPLVELGNVSYSVYLIHWPLFQLYGYAGLIKDGKLYSFEGIINLGNK
jgi:peptidoglycan/LPS O-acetylase OafA/YrhL